MQRTPSEMLQGTVDILILRALAVQTMHGYAISRWLDDRSDGVLSVEGAALYQGLHRLERQKLIAAEWGVSENNRSAKFYRLSAAGRRRLAVGSSSWHRFVEQAGRALRATSPAPA